MTPGEVLDALDEPFGLLNGTGVPGLGHHRQTLAGAIDWSYALLDDTERSIFNRLGVFSSTFDMVAAREVVNGEGIDVAAVPDVVRALVTKSMLVVDESDGEELRFALLEPLREYARQKISELGVEPTWRRRHAQHYARDMGHVATRTGEWFPERHATSGDLANIRAATNWAIRSLDPGDAELCRALLSSAAGHEHPGVRALAIEGLLTLYQLDDHRGTRTMLELLDGADPDTRDVVLRATCILRAPATAVFGWVIANGDNELRRAAAHMLCLNWSAEPSSISALLLHDLAAKVRLWRPARSRVLLEFIAEVTIMTYVSHLEEPGIAEQISAVWREVFTRRLHLNALNRPLVEGPIAAVAARTFAQRIVEADLMADLQDPLEFFEAHEAEKTRPRRIVPLVDPAEDLTPHGDDLHALLDSPILVSRLMATRVLGVHSLANYGRLRGWLDSFFLQATGRARVWMLLAFCLPFSETPREWLTDLEGFTMLLLDENRLVIESSDDGSLEDFDFIFLPLALAYAKQGAAMSLINASTQSACDSKDLCVWEHCLVGLGVAGYYSPNAALDALGTVISAAEDPLLRNAVVRSLAMIHTLHADRVDDFLVDAGEARLSPLVREQVDFALAKRYVQRVGFFNTSVNNSIHYPRMRLGLTMPAGEILSQVPDTGQYVEMYTRGVLKMLREAHYDLMAWMLP